MRCDAGFRFEPHSLDYDRNPHPIHAHLRENHRVFHWQEMDAWVLSHHGDIDWLLKHAPVGTSPVHRKNARAEAAEMLGQLVGRFPELKLAGEPEFAPHFNIRLMTSLRVRLGEARPRHQRKENASWISD
ncbi:hypothetical protein K2X89_13705 [Myxococcota bacterium]|nr:hypothetical protein [Myxococcota bacterium]